MGKPSKKDREIIDTAIKQLKNCVSAEEHNRTAAIEDLKFANGDQWDYRERKRRADKGRPALVINFLPKFIDQVVGDMLHNAPSVKVRPKDSKADPNIAKIRQGIISDIEYHSNAKAIYGYASRQMVTCGYGGWRVLTRYTEENPFLQEIYLESIRNPFLIYMDPASKDQNYADAKYGFLLERMPREEFENRYPKAQMVSDSLKTGKGLSDELWYDGDHVTVAEYFTREVECYEMLQLKDGRVVTEEEFKTIHDEWKQSRKKLKLVKGLMDNITQLGAPPQPTGMGTPPAQPNAGAPNLPPQMPMGQPAPQPPPMAPMGQPAPQLPNIPEPDEPKVAKRKECESIVIRHRVLTCNEILEGGTEGNVFPGKFIPLVLLKGKELNIEGKNYVYGLIRNAKDPQKMSNYWNTAAAETIALAPKAPWLATPKQIEGFERDYASANVENYPVIQYNPDPEAPGPPQRLNPSQPPVAIFEQIRRGEDNIKSVIGLFNADVGAPGSEQTGAAINARQRPGDIGTFEFSENLARAVLYTGKIINEMIPDVYDTERDVRVREFDDTETFVPINTTIGNALKDVTSNTEHFNGIDVVKLRDMFSKNGKDAKYNDITVGKYDIRVTTGPSYATQRQESAQHLLQLVQAMPQQMALASDLIVQNMDFKDADELAGRLRKTLPPGMAKPRPGEPPPPQPPPNPQLLLAQEKMKLEQGKQQLQLMKIEQEKIKLEHEKIKMQLEIIKLQQEQADAGKMVAPDPIKQIEMQEKEVRLRAELMEKERRLRLEEERLNLEKERFNHQREQEGRKHDSEIMRHEHDLIHKSRMADIEEAKLMFENDPLRIRKKDED